MLKKGFKDFVYEKAIKIIEEYRDKEFENVKEEELVIEATMIKVLIEKSSELILKIQQDTNNNFNVETKKIHEDEFIEYALKKNRLFAISKVLFEQMKNLSTHITIKIIFDNWNSNLGPQKGIEKYFNTPDDLFNTKAFYWRYANKNKKLFDNLEVFYQIMMRYFDFLEMYEQPITCAELIINDCKKHNLNKDQIIFILDNFTEMLFQSENPVLSNVYIELIDTRHEICPFDEEEGFYDNIWNIERLREEANQYSTILERIRFLRHKQLEYKRESEELNADIGINEEIEIEVKYLEDLLEHTKKISLTDKQEKTQMQDKFKILFLGANPTLSRLRLDEEVREIQTNLKIAKERDKLELVQEWAVTPQNLIQSVLDNCPKIIHFSGHGQIEGIILEDNSGKPKIITGDALAGLFDLFKDSIECVVLNSCYSEEQAIAIKKKVPYVIGMNTAIPDKAAIAFSVGFYKGVGAGKSIPFSFKLGISAIMLEGISGDKIPKLLED